MSERFTRHLRADSADAAIAETKRRAAREGFLIRTVASCRPCPQPGMWAVVLIVGPRAQA